MSKMCNFAEKYNPSDLTLEKANELLDIEICQECFNEYEDLFRKKSEKVKNRNKQKTRNLHVETLKEMFSYQAAFIIANMDKFDESTFEMFQTTIENLENTLGPRFKKDLENRVEKAVNKGAF